MKTMYQIRVKETGEETTTITEKTAIEWMRQCRKVANIWGGVPTFEVEKITTETIFINID